MEFKEWLYCEEQDNLRAAQEGAKLLQDALKQLAGNPEKVKEAIRQLGVDVDAFERADPQTRVQMFGQLTKKLEANPQVQQILRTYQQMQAQTPMPEWVLQEGFWNVVWTIFRPVTFLIQKFLETVAYVLQPIPLVGGLLSKAVAPWKELEDTFGRGKVQYTGMLLLTFLLSPMLVGVGLATGNPAAVAAGVGTMGYSATWWATMMFGHTVLRPILMAAEG